MALPPGPVYLLKHIPYLVVPSATVYLALRLARDFYVIPTWLLALATVLARPLLTVLRNRYTDFQNRREAASFGAELPPHVPESSFAIAKKLLENVKTGYPGDIMFEWSKTYGNTFTLDRFTSRVIFTQDPALVKASLATQFDNFEKGAQFTDQNASLLGTGIFNVDGDMWKFHRGITRPFFTKERISDFEIYDRNCDVSLNLARERLSEGHPVEFQDLVGRFTLDSATEFLFGHNVDSLSAGIPYPPSHSDRTPVSFHNHPSNIFVKAFNNGQFLASTRSALAEEWPLGEFWHDKVAELREVMDGFTEPLMSSALGKREKDLQAQEKGQKQPEEDLNLLSHLVKNTQDQSVIKDELVNLLVAGRDTTACLLTFCMYMLTEHPDIERRLREEIVDKVGPTESPTYENMRDMKFMRAFLNEVLRLYPSVPINVRRTKNAIVIPSNDSNRKPMYLPANTGLVYSVLNIQRRTDLWGPTALEFDPDRFLDERLHKFVTPNPFIFCPFNAGPRICLGQQFAYHEATFFLVRLLQRFTGFRLDSKTNVSPPKAWLDGSGTKHPEKVHPVSHLTMYLKGGLWVYMDELKPNDV